MQNMDQYDDSFNFDLFPELPNMEESWDLSNIDCHLDLEDYVKQEENQLVLQQTSNAPNESTISSVDVLPLNSSPPSSVDILPLNSPPPSSLMLHTPSSTNKNRTSRKSAEYKQEKSTEEILKLNIKEFNKVVNRMSEKEREEMKSKRRQMKNRGYARTCRTRKVGQQSDLKVEVSMLVKALEKVLVENSQLKDEIECLKRQLGLQ